jgi:hypothetical protein
MKDGPASSTSMVDAGVFRAGDLSSDRRPAHGERAGRITRQGLVGCPARRFRPLGLSGPARRVVTIPSPSRCGRRPRDDYRDAHPARPVLVVEVAESSLGTDRGQKGSLYARAGVADYWIVNLVDRVVEVRRNPVRDPSAPFGWIYRSVEALGPGAHIAPLGAPEARSRSPTCSRSLVAALGEDVPVTLARRPGRLATGAWRVESSSRRSAPGPPRSSDGRTWQVSGSWAPRPECRAWRTGFASSARDHGWLRLLPPNSPGVAARPEPHGSFEVTRGGKIPLDRNRHRCRLIALLTGRH